VVTAKLMNEGDSRNRILVPVEQRASWR